MSLRDKPTPLDWVGVGLRAVGVMLSARDELRRAEASNPWRFFADPRGEPWTEVPEEFRRLVLDHATQLEVDDRYWDGDEQSPFLVRAKLGEEVVAWIGEGTSILDGPYVLTRREAETFRALGERLWKKLGSRQLLFGASGLVADPFDDGAVIPTAQMQELLARMRGFLVAGEPRSYLLAGPPGTGKSVAIRWLVSSLELTSVRIDLGVLARLHGSNSASVATSLETLLQLLRPRAMILDDLDRVAVNAPLLAFLELARRTCTVVVASANSVGKMMGAAVRPGRFDDIVKVDRLDPAVLRTLLAGNLDLVDRMATLPAAYVVEAAKRIRVLGRTQALHELDELVARSQQVGASPDTDQDD